MVRQYDADLQHSIKIPLQYRRLSSYKFNFKVFNGSYGYVYFLQSFHKGVYGVHSLPNNSKRHHMQFDLKHLLFSSKST